MLNKKELNGNAKKLVEALRSGKYSQTKARLRDQKGFCCLGVGCDLYAKEHNIDWKLSEDGEKYHLGEASCFYLPDYVRRWLNFTGAAGEYGTTGFTLSSRNDNGFTFSEIADLIESQPEGLFNE